MALPRAIAQGRLLPGLIYSFHAAPRTVSPIKTTIAARQFNRSSRSLFNASRYHNEEVRVQSPVMNVPKDPKAVIIKRVNRRARPSDVEQMLKSRNLEPKRVQLRLDRFKLHNDSLCFLEFESEEQAAKAIEVLNGLEFMHQKFIAEHLNAGTTWGRHAHTPRFSRYFFPSETTVAEAIRPISEGRRMMLAVATPGWGQEDMKVSQRTQIAKEIIEKFLGPYGLESYSNLSPFYGDKTSKPRMLGRIDFATKEGAERAARDFHDTEIEGRQVWLQLSTLSPWRAHRIGMFDPKLLADLQGKGLAPEAVSEDAFLTPKDKTPKNKTIRARRVKTDAKSAEKAVEEAATQA